MKINLYDHQKKAIKELRSGSILWGGVGSGKTLTSLAYFYIVECGGKIYPQFKKPTKPKDIYVITPANKRDKLDWEKEAAWLGISKDKESSVSEIKLTVDSWNNIKKYKNVENAFFVFDEQKLVGSGAWVKSFIKISKKNNWILLSATPGDTWLDYAPIFIANGFYKNRTEFIRRHVVYNTYTSYPKVDRYVNEELLKKLKEYVLVKMDSPNKTIKNIIQMIMPYDENKFERIYKDRWNPFKNKPIQTASEACYSMRRVVNSDFSRFEACLQILEKHKKIIIFYNFDYELDILRRLCDVVDIPVAEYNGHIHEPIPNGNSWVYLAQYNSASEAWNCTKTNAMVLYSRNYSYKMTTQAMGRIDRQNTPFLNLYYYFFTSESPIDKGITKAYSEKKNFNEAKFVKI